MVDFPEYSHVSWLLNGEPRLAQLEALSRSLFGLKIRDNKTSDPIKRKFSSGLAKGWGHFMEMRVGKTPTTLNEIEWLKQTGEINRALIISPNRFKPTWGTEIQKFGCSLTPHVYESGPRGRKDLVAINKNKKGLAVIVNYEALTHDSNYEIIKDFVGPDTILIADESAYIKNRESLMTVRSLELGKEVPYTRALSGLPCPQSVLDFYSQLRFIKKLNGKNFFQFRARYAKMGGFRGKKVVDIKNEEMLVNALGLCSFVAKRADWAESLGVDYETINLELPKPLATAYNSMLEDFYVWLEAEGEVVSTEAVLTKYTKLQQIVTGFIINEFKEIKWIMPFKNTPKFKSLLEQLELDNNKTLVICKHKAAIDALYNELKKSYDPAVIAGSDFMKRRGLDVETEKNRFNNDPKCRVLVGQVQAIKYGHTLMGTPGDPCLTTVYFENDYSLDNRAQSEQRNQGNGQVAPIHVIDMVAGEIDMKVIDALQRKQSVADVLLNTQAGVSKNRA